MKSILTKFLVFAFLICIPFTTKALTKIDFTEVSNNKVDLKMTFSDEGFVGGFDVKIKITGDVSYKGITWNKDYSNFTKAVEYDEKKQTLTIKVTTGGIGSEHNLLNNKKELALGSITITSDAKKNVKYSLEVTELQILDNNWKSVNLKDIKTTENEFAYVYKEEATKPSEDEPSKPENPSEDKPSEDKPNENTPSQPGSSTDNSNNTDTNNNVEVNSNNNSTSSNTTSGNTNNNTNNNVNNNSSDKNNNNNNSSNNNTNNNSNNGNNTNSSNNNNSENESTNNGIIENNVVDNQVENDSDSTNSIVEYLWIIILIVLIVIISLLVVIYRKKHKKLDF